MAVSTTAPRGDEHLTDLQVGCSLRNVPPPGGRVSLELKPTRVELGDVALGHTARSRLTLRNNGPDRVDGRWTADRAIGVEPSSFTLEAGEETHASIAFASYSPGPKRGRARCTATGCVVEVEVFAVVSAATSPRRPVSLEGNVLLAAYLANPSSEEVARTLLERYLSRERLRRSMKLEWWQHLSVNDERVDDFTTFALHFIRDRLPTHAATIDTFDAWIRKVTWSAAGDYLRTRGREKAVAASQLGGDDEAHDVFETMPVASPSTGDAEVEATVERLRRRAQCATSARDWLTFRLYEAFERPVTPAELDAACLSPANLHLELDRVDPAERKTGLPPTVICGLLDHPSTASVHTAKRRVVKTIEAEYRLHAHLRRLAVLARGLPLGRMGPQPVSRAEWLLFRMAYQDELGAPGPEELGEVDAKTLAVDPRARARTLNLPLGAFRTVQRRLIDEAEWLSGLAQARRHRTSLASSVPSLPWSTLAAAYAPELGPVPVDELRRARPDRTTTAEQDRRALAELERKAEGLDAAGLATLLDLDVAALMAHLVYAKPEVSRAMQDGPVSEGAS